MKIAIFGGAFNPVHLGHVNLARQYIEILKLDRLLIIPTYDPPHRKNDLISVSDRINMLNIAFGGVKNVEISDIEARLKGKSYTFNTIGEIKKQYPDAELFLIVGEDQFLAFDKWYKFEEILTEVTVCTAQRNENKTALMHRFAKETLGTKNYFIANFDPVVVSSSEIREKLKNGENVDTLISKDVLEYIKKHELYTE